MRQAIVLINFCLTIRIQMGIYATLGVGQALATFLNGTTIVFIVYSASRQMSFEFLVFPYLTVG